MLAGLRCRHVVADRSYDADALLELIRASGAKAPHSFAGDVGYVDADGFLHLTERKAFMIISGGVNVYPGGGPALAEELLAFCRQHLSAMKCPRSIDFEAELPRHPTGKLYKRLLRDRYWQGRREQDRLTDALSVLATRSLWCKKTHRPSFTPLENGRCYSI